MFLIGQKLPLSWSFVLIHSVLPRVPALWLIHVHEAAPQLMNTLRQGTMLEEIDMLINGQVASSPI